jgi:ferredoxin
MEQHAFPSWGSFLRVGRLYKRVRTNGTQTAYTPRRDLCLASGLCVVACPERAIRLVETHSKEVLKG